MTQTSGVRVKQVVFLTVNHRGPLPLRELHSTGETIVWRDPGGSWACLPPVYDYECEITLPQAVTHVAYTRKSTVRRTEPKDENEPNEMLNKTKPLSWIKQRKTRLKKEALRTKKGTILSTKLNSTTTTRIWVEEGPWESPKEIQCEMRGALVIEPLRRRPKEKEKKKKRRKKKEKKKAAPSNAKKNRTIKKNSSVDEGLKQDRKSTENRWRSQTKC